MQKMNDIYYYMDTKLDENWMFVKSIDDKKRIFDNAMKEYLLEKISQLGIDGVLESSHKDEVSTVELVEVLGALIPEENHFDTLRHLTHCVINVASFMQRKMIVWYSEEKPEFINNQSALFDSEGYWDSFSTHKEDSYVSDFEFAYDVFMNDFMVKQKVLKQEKK